MAEHEWELRLRELAVGDVQVGPTDRAGEDAHEDLAAPNGSGSGSSAERRVVPGRSSTIARIPPV